MKDKAEQWSRLACSRWPVFLLILCSVWPLYVGLVAWDNQGDDTYITLTYSKNLARGDGFVYNEGPPSLGTTTPLFALLVAAGAVVLRGIDVAHLGVWLSVFCWIGTAWTVYLGRKPLSLAPAQAALVGAVCLMGGWWSLGNELYLFQLLLLLTLIAFNASRYLLTGILVGALFLTRGEGGLFLPLLVGSEWASQLGRHRKKPLSMLARDSTKIAVGFAFIFVLWSLYSLHTFGRILPETLEIKLSQRRLGIETGLENKLLLWTRYWWHRPGFSWLSYLYWGLSVVGSAAIVVQHRRLLMLLIWPLLYMGAYIAMRVPAYYWYQYSAYFVWMILIGLGIWQIAQIGAHARSRRIRALSIALSIVLISCVLGPHLWVRPLWPYGVDPRATGYRELCAWINKNVPRGQMIAVAEVGYVGYFTDNPIVDLMGLTCPEFKPYALKGDFYAGYAETRPDVYVDRTVPDIPFLATIRHSTVLAREYVKAATIHDPSMPMSLDVYTRVRNR